MVSTSGKWGPNDMYIDFPTSGDHKPVARVHIVIKRWQREVLAERVSTLGRFGGVFPFGFCWSLLVEQVEDRFGHNDTNC